MDEGYEVDVAEDGVQGCEMAEREKYSVIFCDIKMPNMDGIEVLGKLGEAGVDSAVIMISGHGDIDTAVECIKKGAFDFIQKPLDLNKIFVTIKNATEKVSLVEKNRNLAAENKTLKKKVYRNSYLNDMRKNLNEARFLEKNERREFARRRQKRREEALNSYYKPTSSDFTGYDLSIFD